MAHTHYISLHTGKNTSIDCLSGCYDSISTSRYNCTAVRCESLFVNFVNSFFVLRHSVDIDKNSVWFLQFQRGSFVGATGSWVWSLKIPKKEGIMSLKVLHYWNNKASIFLCYTNPLRLFEVFIWLKMCQKLDPIPVGTHLHIWQNDTFSCHWWEAMTTKHVF